MRRVTRISSRARPDLRKLCSRYPSMKPLALVLLLAVLALPTATAGAATTTSRPAAARLRVEVTRLQARLRVVTAERDEARSVVLRLEHQVTSLLRRVDAVRSPLAIAEEQVGKEVGWSAEALRLGPNATGPAYAPAELTALATMNYVATHVSSTTYAFSIPPGLPLPASLKTLVARANAVLAAQAGPCNYHMYAFIAIMLHFGFQVRDVGFAYRDSWTGEPGSHVGAEVYYDGAWHFFDPTYDVYWTGPASGDVLSIDQARSGGGTLHKNDGLFLNLFEDPLYGGNDTEFETDRATRVSFVYQ